jgi:type II secretion system protein H
MRRGDFRGITLIELLVVLTLVALISSVAGPAVARQFDAIALRSSATEFAALLRRAQAVARAAQVPVVMTYKDHEFRFWEKSKLVSQYTLPASITPAAHDIPAYVFLPSGQIIGGDALEFQNQRGRKIRVKTDLLGAITYE